MDGGETGGESGEGGENGNNNENTVSGNTIDYTQSFSNLQNTISNQTTAINNMSNTISNEISTVNNTATGIWGTIRSILNFINPLSEDFFVYKLIDLLIDALKTLFVPTEDFINSWNRSMN